MCFHFSYSVSSCPPGLCLAASSIYPLVVLRIRSLGFEENPTVSNEWCIFLTFACPRQMFWDLRQQEKKKRKKTSRRHMCAQAYHDGFSSSSGYKILLWAVFGFYCSQKQKKMHLKPERQRRVWGVASKRKTRVSKEGGNGSLQLDRQYTWSEISCSICVPLHWEMHHKLFCHAFQQTSVTALPGGVKESTSCVEMLRRRHA